MMYSRQFGRTGIAALLTAAAALTGISASAAVEQGSPDETFVPFAYEVGSGAINSFSGDLSHALLKDRGYDEFHKEAVVLAAAIAHELDNVASQLESAGIAGVTVALDTDNDTYRATITGDDLTVKKIIGVEELDHARAWVAEIVATTAAETTTTSWPILAAFSKMVDLDKIWAATFGAPVEVSVVTASAKYQSMNNRPRTLHHRDLTGDNQQVRSTGLAAILRAQVSAFRSVVLRSIGQIGLINPRRRGAVVTA